MVHAMPFPMINVFYFYISIFRNMCAVPSMTVFCSFLNSCFPVVLLMYFVSDFAVVPVATVINGITFVFAFNLLLLLFITETWEIVCTHCADDDDDDDDALTG